MPDSRNVRTIDARLGGVGDLAVALWIAEGARRQGETVPIAGYGDVVRAFGLARAQGVSPDRLATGTDSTAYQEELRTSEDRSPRTLRWQRTHGWDYPPARPRLLALPKKARRWGEAMSDARTVVVAPRANFTTRTLPDQKWLRVAWALQAEGFDVVAIDRDKEAVDRFPRYAFGFGWTHVLALMERAALVLGNDSGISHLAATLGVPAVVAMGPTDPAIVFGHADNVRAVRSEATPCVGCHFRQASGFSAPCDVGCEALHLLPWEALRDAALACLQRSS